MGQKKILRRQNYLTMEYETLYRLGVERLKEAQIDEALLDARLLLEEVCGTDRNYLLVHGNNSVSEENYNCYVNYIEKRSHHIPLQHILEIGRAHV